MRTLNKAGATGRAAKVVASGCVAVLLAACGAPVDPDAGRGSDVPPDISDLCGTRTSLNTPLPGVLRSVSRSTIELSPEDTGLANVISIIRGVDSCDGSSAETVVEYEIGADGLVLSVDGETPETERRFVISDGCLQIQTTPDAGADDGGNGSDGSGSDDGGSREDGGNEDPGPCGESGFPLFQKLTDNDPETDPYVCIEVAEGESCQDCSDGDGGWTFTTRTTVTFRATRSLAFVQALDLCTFELSESNIRIGETVTATLISTTRFEPIIPDP
ncbi:MAG: hypothetical protein BroJett003_13640 [Planctomycetota bacterium]|nr:MAG: hypothetical protein BroJett003_13640 [Planctomycetota bacterium]